MVIGTPTRLLRLTACPRSVSGAQRRCEPFLVDFFPLVPVIAITVQCRLGWVGDGPAPGGGERRREYAPGPPTYHDAPWIEAVAYAAPLLTRASMLATAANQRRSSLPSIRDRVLGILNRFVRPLSALMTSRHDG